MSIPAAAQALLTAEPILVNPANPAAPRSEVSPPPVQNPDPADSATPSDAVDRLLDRIVSREQEFLDSLRAHTPLFETYIQERGAPAPGIQESGGEAGGPPAPTAPAPPSGEEAPTKDHYFLGRVRVDSSIGYEPLIAHTDPPPPPPARLDRLLGLFAKPDPPPPAFLPRGFAQMAIIDLQGFNRDNYRFEYVRREFLGELRCLVFDLTPTGPEPGRFVGRIWVEDHDDSIVRFNGTYVPVPETDQDAPAGRYFHFDSWRVNVAPGEWVPAEIYVEEEGSKAPNGIPRFKAQTRVWDYAAAPTSRLEELTQILIESDAQVSDQDATRDVSPLESQRAWERQAEENVLARLEQGGLLAPAGAVDEVLNTVVNNLIISAELNVEARCRVLLTTPMETFTIGHTIVISRGLIDVLPDEASLALVLADELAHIALAHPTPTQFAFHNQTMMSDAELLENLRFERTPQELAEAGVKTIEIMRASPYQDTSNAGLFLKALAARRHALPRLLAANLGNQVANEEALQRLAAFTAEAPELDEEKLEQIAALPLGSRVRLDPFRNQIALVATKPIALLSPREKMPFEVTPFVLYLTRARAADGEATAP